MSMYRPDTGDIYPALTMLDLDPREFVASLTVLGTALAIVVTDDHVAFFRGKDE